MPPGNSSPARGLSLGLLCPCSTRVGCPGRLLLVLMPAGVVAMVAPLWLGVCRFLGVARPPCVCVCLCVCVCVAVPGPAALSSPLLLRTSSETSTSVRLTALSFLARGGCPRITLLWIRAMLGLLGVSLSAARSVSWGLFPCFPLFLIMLPVFGLCRSPLWFRLGFYFVRVVAPSTAWGTTPFWPKNTAFCRWHARASTVFEAAVSAQVCVTSRPAERPKLLLVAQPLALTAFFCVAGAASGCAASSLGGCGSILSRGSPSRGVYGHHSS